MASSLKVILLFYVPITILHSVPQLPVHQYLTLIELSGHCIFFPFLVSFRVLIFPVCRLSLNSLCIFLLFILKSLWCYAAFPFTFYQSFICCFLFNFHPSLSSFLSRLDLSIPSSYLSLPSYTAKVLPISHFRVSFTSLSAVRYMVLGECNVYTTTTATTM